jgi:hypothetical protein
MKYLITSALLASLAGLTGCATPAADSAADATLASNDASFEDKGELLTGSRIPQKSTAHTVKRIGSAEYKKSQMEGGQHNPAEHK